MHANAELSAGGVVQTQVQQGLAQVVVCLAAGDQAEPVMSGLDDVVVQAVGADVGQRGIPLVVEQALLLVQRGVRPAYVHATGRHLEIPGQPDLHALGIDHRRGRGLDDLLDGLHAGPHAGVAAEREGMDAQVQDFLHGGGKENRQATGLEDVVALMGGR